MLKLCCAILILAVSVSGPCLADDGDKTMLYLGNTSVVTLQANQLAREAFAIGTDEEFKVKATEALRAYLTDHILETRKFEVVEREGAGEVLLEGGPTTEADSAQYAILGKIVLLTLNSSYKSSGVKVVVDYKKATSLTDAKLQIQLRVVDVKTLKTITTATKLMSGSVSDIAEQLGASIRGTVIDNESKKGQNNLIWPLIEGLSRELAIEVLTDAYPITITGKDEQGRLILDYGPPVLWESQTLDVRAPDITNAGSKRSGNTIGRIRVAELDPQYPIAYATVAQGALEIMAVLETGESPICIASSDHHIVSPKELPTCKWCGGEKELCGEIRCLPPAQHERFGVQPSFMAQEDLR